MYPLYPLARLMMLLIGIASFLLPTYTTASETQQHAQKSLEIYRSILEIPTVAGRGNGQKIVDYLSSELIAAGFEPRDITQVKVDDAVGLVARYAGTSNSKLRPILLLGHLDVVEALAKDWDRPPFKLTEDNEFYYGRGSVDNKYGVAMLTATFVRLKQQRFVPNRDLYLVFSGDEETSMLTTQKLAYDTAQIKDAEFAINSDTVSGSLDTNGKAISFNVQAAEKTFATFNVTIKNPGGHSSRPRPDNAIYQLASVLSALENYSFAVNSSSVTRHYFRATSRNTSGELAAAMLTFAEDPSNVQAIKKLDQYPQYMSLIRTTCVATMLEAGHAENALPQSATATINCRILPGETVTQVQQQLQTLIESVLPAKVVESLTSLELDVRYPESSTSEPRDDVMAAVRKAVDTIDPNVPLVPFITQSASDGMYFRSANIPTWGVSSVFLRPEDNFTHGLNERLPKKAFAQGLDFWTVLIAELTSTN